MSIQLDYTQSKDVSGTDFGSRNNTVNMRQVVLLNPSKRHGFRVLRIMLSNQIPNIYNYGGFDTTKINISNDGGATWTAMTLKNGIYTLQMIEECITDVCNQNGWLIKASDPALIISYNPATQIVYIKIDSTKLQVGTQFCVNFGVSKIYEMLGFNANACSFSVDGLHSATNVPQMDSQGNYIDVFMSCIQGTRYVNGQLSNSICRLPILSGGENEIIYPSANTGSVTPLIKAIIPSEISTFTIRFVNAMGRDAVFLMGNAIVEIELMEL